MSGRVYVNHHGQRLDCHGIREVKMPFYKRDVTEILSAPNFVKCPEFELFAEAKARSLGVNQ